MGRSTLSHILESGKGFPISWIADSKSIVSKESEPFTPKEIKTIIELKAKSRSPVYGGRDLVNVRTDEFRGSRQELRILNSIMTTKEEWIVFDTTALASIDDYELAKSMMGVAGFCTANKTSWADHILCSDLYHHAEKHETFLGLNCTTGVWVDQMESLPLVVKHFTRGHMTITKRDNSSLNTFFAMVDSSTKPDEAIKEIERAGHLEPGSKDLSKEVHDQVLKASIAANICGILKGIRPYFDDETSNNRDRPQSMSPADIARWHNEGYRNKEFRVLVTTIALDANLEKLLQCTVSFSKLPKGSPLAKHFFGKSAIYIESTSFPCRSDEYRGQDSRGYFHAGYGGGERTAAKLLWEARRISRLRPFRGKVPFTPMPVLFAEEIGHESEVRLREEIFASLG